MGFRKPTMRALASGQQRVDGMRLLHSSAFQLMITDALKYRMAQQSVGKAVTRPGAASAASGDQRAGED